MITFGPIGPFYLAASFIVSVDSSICIDLGINLNWKEKGKEYYYFYIDINGKIEPSLTLDLGVYFPSPFDPIRMSLNFGIHGILTSITAGIKLSLFMGENKFEIDYYYVFKAYEFSFYILLRFEMEINLKFFKINLTFQFYIFNKIFAGRKYEKHLLRYYKYFHSEMKELRTIKNGWIKK